jgi:hypothetical protein
MTVKENSRIVYRKIPIGHLPPGSYFMIFRVNARPEIYMLDGTGSHASIGIDYRNGETVVFDPGIVVEQLFHAN